MRLSRPLSAVTLALAPLALVIACGGSSPPSAHATKPLGPAEGANDYETAGGPAATKPPIPGPEKPVDSSGSALQPGKNEGK
jgi:hypothetical protein